MTTKKKFTGPKKTLREKKVRKSRKRAGHKRKPLHAVPELQAYRGHDTEGTPQKRESAWRLRAFRLLSMLDPVSMGMVPGVFLGMFFHHMAVEPLAVKMVYWWTGLIGFFVTALLTIVGVVAQHVHNLPQGGLYQGFYKKHTLHLGWLVGLYLGSMLFSFVTQALGI